MQYAPPYANEQAPTTDPAAAGPPQQQYGVNYPRAGPYGQQASYPHAPPQNTQIYNQQQQQQHHQQYDAPYNHQQHGGHYNNQQHGGHQQQYHGHNYSNPNHQGGGGGGYRYGFDEARRRDDERDRERARNGTRGVRSGFHHHGAGGLGWGHSAMSLEVQRLKELVNPTKFDCEPRYVRFYIVKSYTEDDIIRSVQRGLWSTTSDSGNQRLDAAFQEAQGRGPIYLFFAVNASGQFVGVAKMESGVDYTKTFGDWGPADKSALAGAFAIKWIFLKDVPNNQFRGITLPNNDFKPVTNTRDTQEVLGEEEGGSGHHMLRIFHGFKQRSSVLDDYGFYTKRQELAEARAQMLMQVPQMGSYPPVPIGGPMGDLMTQGLQGMGMPGMQMQGMPGMQMQGMPGMQMQGIPGMGVPSMQMQGMGMPGMRPPQWPDMMSGASPGQMSGMLVGGTGDGVAPPLAGVETAQPGGVPSLVGLSI